MARSRARGAQSRHRKPRVPAQITKRVRQEGDESVASEDATSLGDDPHDDEVIRRQQEEIKALKTQIKNRDLSKEELDKYNDDLKNLIQGVVSTIGWRTTKFLSNTAQTDAFCRKIYDNLGIDKSWLHGNTFELWRDTYKSCCVTALNTIRTYVVQRIRNATDNYLSNPNKGENDMPTFEQIRSCVDRTIDLKVEGNTELWTWYCDYLVPRAAGYAQAFDVNLKCFERISTSHLPNAPNSLRIPSSTEAFIGLCFDCYRSVWLAQFVYKEEHGRNAKLPKIRSTNGKIREEDKKWVSKYTSPDTGSKKLSGWSLEGMTKFTELCQSNRQARTTRLSTTLEERALVLLKAKHGIESDNVEDWLATKTTKKAKKIVPEPAGIEFIEEE